MEKFIAEGSEKTKPIYRPLAGNPKYEARNPKQKDNRSRMKGLKVQLTEGYLKKQTQFLICHLDVNDLSGEDYGDMPRIQG
jgi:hypothetical protein